MVPLVCRVCGYRTLYPKRVVRCEVQKTRNRFGEGEQVNFVIVWKGRVRWVRASVKKLIFRSRTHEPLYKVQTLESCGVTLFDDQLFGKIPERYLRKRRAMGPVPAELRRAS
jgi:hypothetical protein